MTTKIRVNRDLLHKDQPAITVTTPGQPTRWARRVDFTHDGLLVASVVQGEKTIWVEPGPEGDMELHV